MDMMTLSLPIMLLICIQWIQTKSFTKLLCDLEKPHAYSLRLLFENAKSIHLYEEVLDKKDANVC